MSGETPDQTDPHADPVSEAAEGLLSVGDGDRLWYAFHTRPRCEKKAAGACRDMPLRHYLPLRESVTRKGKGRYSFQVPLFPSYIFGCCDIEERLRLMRTGFMVRWLEVVDQLQLLGELKSIYVASEKGAGMTLYPQLKRGRDVRVVRGPLAGITGKISRRKESFRLVLNVSALGSAVALEVDIDDVEMMGQ